MVIRVRNGLFILSIRPHPITPDGNSLCSHLLFYNIFKYYTGSLKQSTEVYKHVRRDSVPRGSIQLLWPGLHSIQHPSHLSQGDWEAGDSHLDTRWVRPSKISLSPMNWKFESKHPRQLFIHSELCPWLCWVLFRSAYMSPRSHGVEFSGSTWDSKTVVCFLVGSSALLFKASLRNQHNMPFISGYHDPPCRQWISNDISTWVIMPLFGALWGFQLMLNHFKEELKSIYPAC